MIHLAFVAVVVALNSFDSVADDSNWSNCHRSGPLMAIVVVDVAVMSMAFYLWASVIMDLQRLYVVHYYGMKLGDTPYSYLA